MWREFLLKYAEDMRGDYTMEWREFLKTSSEGRKDDDGGVSLSSPLIMERK